MIDTKKPLRTAYFQVLSNAIQYNGQPVPVGDDMKNFGDSTPAYIVLSSQTESDRSTFQSFETTQDIVIDIVFKSLSRTAKAAVDDIAGQVMSLILPAPSQNGLPIQAGIQILCVEKVDDRDLPALLNNGNTVLRRLLTFRQIIRQTNNSTPVVTLKGIIKVTSSDFTSATDYANPALTNNFYLFDNDASTFLDFGTEWDYLAGGGFTILIPGFNSSLQTRVFYVLLR